MGLLPVDSEVNQTLGSPVRAIRLAATWSGGRRSPNWLRSSDHVQAPGLHHAAASTQRNSPFSATRAGLASARVLGHRSALARSEQIAESGPVRSAESRTYRSYHDASTGAKLWVRRYNGPANGGAGASAVAASLDGSKVFITGTSVTGNVNDYVTVAYEA